MTATSSTGYTPANQDLAQGKSIIPIQVLIVAELSTCRETIRALLELQDLGCIQIIGRVESGVDALQAMMVVAPGSHNSGSSARRGLSAPELSAGKQLSCNQAALLRRGKLGAAYRSQPDLPSTSHSFKGNTARGLSCCARADFGFRHKVASFSNLKTELKTKFEYAKLEVNFAYFGHDCNAPASVPATSLQFLINLLRKKVRSRRSCLYRGCGSSHRVSSARKQAALRQSALEVSNDGK
jgi:hypothetical protein